MVRSREKYLYIFIVWVAFTFVLTSLPRFPAAAGITHLDKVVHLLIYGVSGFLFACYLREGALPRERVFLYTVILIAVIGGADEIHQELISWRVPSFFDWLADLSGGVAGSALVIMAEKWHLFGVPSKNE